MEFLRLSRTLLPSPALALLLLLAAAAPAPAEPPAPRHPRTPARAADLPSPSPVDDGEALTPLPTPRVSAGAFERALGLPAPGLPIGNSNILHRQAVKKLIAHNLEGSLSDLDLAIRISPDDASLYTDRGFARLRGEDSKGAMADWNRAIQLDPKNSMAYSNRGRLKLDLGDTAGGNADLLKAVEVAPHSSEAYMQLADAENLQHDFLNAWSDYRSACDYSDRPPDYAQLAICLIRVRLGEGAAGSENLINYFKENGQTAANAWPSRIADYLARHLPETDLLATATEPDPAKPDVTPTTGRLCEAWYYIGMRKLLNHDKAGAGNAFRECVATGQKWHVEYQLAESELKDLPAGE